MFAEINNIKLWYENIGSGIPLVFIHGLGETADSWRHQVEHFQGSYRTITMDLRGHGRSTYDDKEVITIALFARDVITLLDQLGISKAIFIGHSMGGLICQEIAIHYAEHMVAMVLSDSAGFYPAPFSTEGLKERLTYLETASMEDMAELVAQKCCSPDVIPAVRQEVKDLFMHNQKEPYRQATVATFKADFRQYHQQMTMPALLLVGEYDQTTPLSYAEYLHMALPSSHIVVIPMAGHMSKVENPSDYNQALKGFFRLTSSLF